MTDLMIINHLANLLHLTYQYYFVMNNLACIEFKVSSSDRHLHTKSVCIHFTTAKNTSIYLFLYQLNILTFCISLVQKSENWTSYLAFTYKYLFTNEKCMKNIYKYKCIKNIH